jgi:hypothetical protein
MGKMKKLFVLFLLISLVPFAVGCFGGGYDDDGITLVPFNSSVLLPNELVAPASLRESGKLSYLKLSLKIGGKLFMPSASVDPEYIPATNTASAAWKVIFYANLNLAEAAALRTQKNATIEVTDNSGAAPVTLVTAVVDINMSSTAAVIPEIVVSVVDSKLKVTSFDDSTAAINDAPTSDFPASITYFKVDGVVATNSVTLTKLGEAAPADADYKTIATTTAPVFTITFDKAYVLQTGVSVADIRWVINVNNVNTGNDFTLDSSDAADKALFSIEAVDGSTTSINVTVVGDSTKKLVADTKYQVTFADSNLTTADEEVLAQATYLFKTPAE